MFILFYITKPFCSNGVGTKIRCTGVYLSIFTFWLERERHRVNTAILNDDRTCYDTPGASWRVAVGSRIRG
jgi:hypothetical protein